MSSEGFPQNAIYTDLFTLSHKLNYLVLAEGIEDEETLNYLGQYNCDQGQGYYFSRPLVADNFAQWLALHDASIKS
ncbi:EAL domain-containing protein [Symbiopectobacterium purcellii]|uniref:EAL domain-containing protein n=1 Tax=Symbiopectobacterium purcellii TaxID=2871826 RepID=UPI003F827806